MAVYSPDGGLIVYPDRHKGVAVVERLKDGQSWEVDTQQGHSVGFTPDSQGLIWTAYDEDEPWDTREETIWLASVDGSDARPVFSGRRADPIGWLTDDELLMIQGFADTSDVQLFKLSTEDGAQTILKESPRMRGLALSPDKRHLVYYVRFEPDADQNGVWLMDLTNPAGAPLKLPFFGTYRWRDDHRLIYVPFDPGATRHDFYEYDLLTGQTRSLFPEGTDLIIANNDWQISPDGRKIALVAAKGTELDGIWVVDIEPDYVVFSE
jgi:Tol biopolymer transport system component